MSIKIGTTARYLRNQLGLKQKDAAEALGITRVHLCNIEKNHSTPSQALIDKYRELWGIDLYVLAWCQHGDVDSLPKAMRQAVAKLTDGWNQQLKTQFVGSDNGTDR